MPVWQREDLGAVIDVPAIGLIGPMQSDRDAIDDGDVPSSPGHGPTESCASSEVAWLTSSDERRCIGHHDREPVGEGCQGGLLNDVRRCDAGTHRLWQGAGRGRGRNNRRPIAEVGRGASSNISPTGTTACEAASCPDPPVPNWSKCLPCRSASEPLADSHLLTWDNCISLPAAIEAQADPSSLLLAHLGDAVRHLKCKFHHKREGEQTLRERPEQYDASGRYDRPSYRRTTMRFGSRRPGAESTSAGSPPRPETAKRGR
jgi:hypothetical protein